MGEPELASDFLPQSIAQGLTEAFQAAGNTLPKSSLNKAEVYCLLYHTDAWVQVCRFLFVGQAVYGYIDRIAQTQGVPMIQR